MRLDPADIERREKVFSVSDLAVSLQGESPRSRT